MQLYSVHFTTKHVVSQFDDKGVKTGEYTTEIPQTMHALPHSTALTYQKFGNWRIEPYYADVSKRPIETKIVKLSSVRASSAKPKKAAPKVSAVKTAAETGNLAAAINSGAK